MDETSWTCSSIALPDFPDSPAENDTPTVSLVGIFCGFFPLDSVVALLGTLSTFPIGGIISFFSESLLMLTFYRTTERDILLMFRVVDEILV